MKISQTQRQLDKTLRNLGYSKRSSSCYWSLDSGKRIDRIIRRDGTTMWALKKHNCQITPSFTADTLEEIVAHIAHH
jgi:hypothetical protein